MPDYRSETILKPLLVECIDNLSGGNIRIAIDLVKDFLGSGHVDTQKIADISRNSTRLYQIPLHEFLRASIYGDHIYYHPERSIFANLFDVSQNDTSEHFLLPILLAVLRQVGHTNHGFLATNEIYASLQGLGFTPEQIDYAIVRAHRKRLIETPASQQPTLEGNTPRMMRATTVGLYHVDRLLSSFPYVDAMTVVTPILNEEWRPVILNVQVAAERFTRGRAFKEYLDSAWEKSGFSSLAFHWPAISIKLGGDIETAKQHAGQRRAKRANRGGSA